MPEPVDTVEQTATIAPIDLSSIGKRYDHDIHLGLTAEKQGQYKDQGWVDTNNGFRIIVQQASHGPKSLRVAEEENFKVRALTKDYAGQIHWESLPPDKENLNIEQTWSTLGKVVGSDIKDKIKAKLDKGNEHYPAGGPLRKYGFIEVMDTKKDKKRFFAIGAIFSGQPDDWTVHISYLEFFSKEANH